MITFTFVVCLILVSVDYVCGYPQYAEDVSFNDQINFQDNINLPNGQREQIDFNADVSFNEQMMVGRR